MHDAQFVDSDKPNYGTPGSSQTFGSIFLLQLGFLMLLPLFTEEW